MASGATGGSKKEQDFKTNPIKNDVGKFLPIIVIPGIGEKSGTLFKVVFRSHFLKCLSYSFGFFFYISILCDRPSFLHSLYILTFSFFPI